jgi:hypothetical protein
MATYNPRAGMPPRKTYKEGAPNTLRFASLKSELDLAVERLAALPEPKPEDSDANALRSWLLGYMDSIGDQHPDLAQWRRIREEVGRSVVAKEAVRDTAVPVKKVEAPKTTTYEWHELAKTIAYTDQYYKDVAVKQLEALMGHSLAKNLCGND